MIKFVATLTGMGAVIAFGVLPVNSASLAGGPPQSVCQCFEEAYQLGFYNFTPRNSPQAETLRFKCGMEGWRQAFDEGHLNGQKNRAVSRGDYSLGSGTSLCPY